MSGSSTGTSTGATQGPPTTGEASTSGVSVGTTGTGGASVGESTTTPTGSATMTGTTTDTASASATTVDTTGPVSASSSGGDSEPGTASSSGGDTGSSSGEGTSGAVSASSGEGSSSSGDGGCKTVDDCPPPPGPGECVEATCEAGICGAGPVPQGTPCSGGKCDAGGECVECLSGADCPSKVCNAGVCAAAACDDKIKNGAESDVDCGGGCPGCANGKTCGAPADCASKTCMGGVCAPAGPACAQGPADPVTGQRCPLFMACTDSPQCGDFVGCQQWFCNAAKTCELNAKVACWTDKGGQCNAEVVFTQQTAPPVDKRFVPPDNVNFREVASLAFTIKNNGATDLYLDKLPLVLDVMGNGSKFDVSSVKIFDNSGGTEHDGGDLLVCLTADPFSFPANGVMGPCAGSAFSRIPKGGSNQFIVNLAFAKEKTFINGRSYRLRLVSTAGIEMKVGFNGPLYKGATCGIPAEGYTGAWVTGQTP